MKKLFLPLLAFLFLVSCETDPIDEAVSPDQSVIVNKNSSKVNSYMIITNSETLSSELEKSIGKKGKITSTIAEIGIVVVESNDPNFENNVLKINGVKSVVPDLIVNWLEPMQVKPLTNPPSIGDNEYFFPLQWGMDDIDAPEAWNAGFTGEGVRIAILDSGIDRDHPDLSPNLNTDLSISFVPGEDYWTAQGGSYFNHGSHVSGIAAGADSNYGIIGVAPYAEIMTVKVLSEITGSGAFSWINAGIVYAANKGADVINMSLGAVLDKNGKFYDEEGNFVEKIPAKYIQEIIHAQQRAIDYAFKKGVTIVVAAGNDYMNADGNGSTIVLPADLNNVITVSATGPQDTSASYSNIGRSLIDIAGPGGDYVYSYSAGDMILSAGAGSSFYWGQGTSMASPHVAGVAALIIGKNGGEMDPHEVAKQLTKSADKVDTNGKSLYFGKGRVNAFRAVTE